jgi:hypothetical protein
MFFKCPGKNMIPRKIGPGTKVEIIIILIVEHCINRCDFGKANGPRR